MHIVSFIISIPVAIFIMALTSAFFIVLILLIQIGILIAFFITLKDLINVSSYNIKIYYDEIIARHHAEYSGETHNYFYCKYLGEVDDPTTKYLECNVGDRAFVIADAKGKIMDLFPAGYYYLSQDLLPFVIVPENVGMPPYKYSKPMTGPVIYKP